MLQFEDVYPKLSRQIDRYVYLFNFRDVEDAKQEAALILDNLLKTSGTSLAKEGERALTAKLLRRVRHGLLDLVRHEKLAVGTRHTAIYSAASGIESFDQLFLNETDDSEAEQSSDGAALLDHETPEKALLFKDSVRQIRTLLGAGKHARIDLRLFDILVDHPADITRQWHQHLETIAVSDNKKRGKHVNKTGYHSSCAHKYRRSYSSFPLGFDLRWLAETVFGIVGEKGRHTLLRSLGRIRQVVATIMCREDLLKRKAQ